MLARFREALDEHHGAEAEIAIRRLTHSKPYGKNGPWAGFNLRTPRDGPWIAFELRNLWSPAPRLRIWHWHWDTRGARKAAEAAYAQLEDLPGFRRLKGGAVFEEPVPALSNAASETISDAISSRVVELVHVGTFDADVRYQQRHYR